MRKLNQTGSLVLPLVIVSAALFVTLSFAIWAFIGRQDFKNNSDKKAAVVAEKAVQAESDRKDAAFAEELKNPNKSFKGPDTYGSLTFDFPKTWNQYVPATSGTFTVNTYFNPDFIPDIGSTAQFALRVQISSQKYSSLLAGYDGQAKAGTVTVTPFRAEKVPSVLGTIVKGTIKGKTEGILVYLPIRDKTIILWTEGPNYTNDFLNTVLPSVSFVP